MLTRITKPESADVGDYLKVAACTAVIGQSVLTWGLQSPLSAPTQWAVGMIYNATKFTAPAFIVGILYTTTRTKFSSHFADYPQYLKKQWVALGIPTVFWTLVYLLGLPRGQQATPFHNLSTFAWQFVNGNAAPHLWYNTMMLQFIVLMPIFWWLARQVTARPGRVKAILIFTAIGYAGWITCYDAFVLHGPQHQSWYLLDRVCFSFGLYAVIGALAACFSRQLTHGLDHYQWGLRLGWLLMIGWTSTLLYQAGLPISLPTTSYIQPTMVGYDLATIGLIVSFAYHQLHRRAPSVPVIHWLATYAYRAYLANVFWLQLIRPLSSRYLSTAPFTVLLGTYLLTWAASFAGAYGLHRLFRLAVPIRN